jgi:membrane protease YdiL (CAAX protease family)
MNIKVNKSYSSPWLFFAISHGWSWFFWITGALLMQEFDTFFVKLPMYIAGIGPAVAGIFLTYLTNERAGKREFWKRLIDFKRIGIGWYAVILLSFPLLKVLTILIGLLTGNDMPQFEAVEYFLENPLAILTCIVSTLIYGPLPEELGWRGYVLDRLQEKWSALTSSFILGVFWALWHLPLFFIKGYYHYKMGFGTPACWQWCISVIMHSIIMTWIYNNNRRSTLSAILFHFMINFIGMRFMLPSKLQFCETLLGVIATVIVVIIWGPKNLTFKNRNMEYQNK